MTTSPTPPTDNLFLRLGRALLNLLRFLFTLALVGGVIAAVYFGAPLLYDRYIAPLEADTSHLQQQIDAQATQIAQLQADLTDWQTALAEASASQQAISQQVEALEGRLQTAEDALATLEPLPETLDALQAAQQTNQEAVETLRLRTEVLGALQTISRAQGYLAQSNYGLAQQALQTAYTLVDALSLDAAQKEEVLASLQRANAALPAQPVVASGHLDFAWARLLALVSPVTAAPATTPTPSPTPTP